MSAHDSTLSSNILLSDFNHADTTSDEMSRAGAAAERNAHHQQHHSSFSAPSSSTPLTGSILNGRVSPAPINTSATSATGIIAAPANSKQQPQPHPSFTPSQAPSFKQYDQQLRREQQQQQQQAMSHHTDFANLDDDDHDYDASNAYPHDMSEMLDGKSNGGGDGSINGLPVSIVPAAASLSSSRPFPFPIPPTHQHHPSRHDIGYTSTRMRDRLAQTRLFIPSIKSQLIFRRKLSQIIWTLHIIFCVLPLTGILYIYFATPYEIPPSIHHHRLRDGAFFSPLIRTCMACYGALYFIYATFITVWIVRARSTYFPFKVRPLSLIYSSNFCGMCILVWLYLRYTMSDMYSFDGSDGVAGSHTDDGLFTPCWSDRLVMGCAQIGLILPYILRAWQLSRIFERTDKQKEKEKVLAENDLYAQTRSRQNSERGGLPGNVGGAAVGVNNNPFSTPSLGPSDPNASSTPHPTPQRLVLGSSAAGGAGTSVPRSPFRSRRTTVAASLSPRRSHLQAQQQQHQQDAQHATLLASTSAGALSSSSSFHLQRRPSTYLPTSASASYIPSASHAWYTPTTITSTTEDLSLTDAGVSIGGGGGNDDGEDSLSLSSSAYKPWYLPSCRCLTHLRCFNNLNDTRLLQIYIFALLPFFLLAISTNWISSLSFLTDFTCTDSSSSTYYQNISRIIWACLFFFEITAFSLGLYKTRRVWDGFEIRKELVSAMMMQGGMILVVLVTIFTTPIRGEEGGNGTNNAPPHRSSFNEALILSYEFLLILRSITLFHVSFCLPLIESYDLNALPVKKAKLKGEKIEKSNLMEDMNPRARKGKKHHHDRGDSMTLFINAAGGVEILRDRSFSQHQQQQQQQHVNAMIGAGATSSMLPRSDSHLSEHGGGGGGGNTHIGVGSINSLAYYNHSSSHHNLYPPPPLSNATIRTTLEPEMSSYLYRNSYIKHASGVSTIGGAIPPSIGGVHNDLGEVLLPRKSYHDDDDEDGGDDMPNSTSFQFHQLQQQHDAKYGQQAHHAHDTGALPPPGTLDQRTISSSSLTSSTSLSSHPSLQPLTLNYILSHPDYFQFFVDFLDAEQDSQLMMLWEFYISVVLYQDMDCGDGREDEHDGPAAADDGENGQHYPDDLHPADDPSSSDILVSRREMLITARYIFEKFFSPSTLRGNGPFSQCLLAMANVLQQAYSITSGTAVRTASGTTSQILGEREEMQAIERVDEEIRKIAEYVYQDENQQGDSMYNLHSSSASTNINPRTLFDSFHVATIEIFAVWVWPRFIRSKDFQRLLQEIATGAEIQQRIERAHGL